MISCHTPFVSELYFSSQCSLTGVIGCNTLCIVETSCCGGNAAQFKTLSVDNRYSLGHCWFDCASCHFIHPVLYNCYWMSCDHWYDTIWFPVRVELLIGAIKYYCHCDVPSLLLLIFYVFHLFESRAGGSSALRLTLHSTGVELGCW